MTFKDHALSSAGDPTDSDRPLSSVPRDCTPFMLSLLIWQAHTTRAPTVFRQSRRNLCAGPSRRGRRPAPPSVQISDAGSTSSPCFFSCTTSGPTSSSTFAGVMGGRDAARKALTCGILYQGGSDQPAAGLLGRWARWGLGYVHVK